MQVWFLVKRSDRIRRSNDLSIWGTVLALVVGMVVQCARSEDRQNQCVLSLLPQSLTLGESGHCVSTPSLLEKPPLGGSQFSQVL